MTLQTLARIGLLALVPVLAACGRGSDAVQGEAHAQHGESTHDDEAARGPHGGRLLEKDGHAVELAIAEDGTPPHYWRPGCTATASRCRRTQARWK